MPRVGDDLLRVVIYLYESREAAERGDRIGGSGFIVSQPRRDGEGDFLYFVTCEHVAFKGAPVVRVLDRDGQNRIFSPTWFEHPLDDDVAVAPFMAVPSMASKTNFAIASIARELFATREDLAAPPMPRPEDGNAWPFGQFIGAGDETVTLGRFVGAAGRERNVPTARFGNLSTADVVEIYVKDRVFNQESFLVEARSLNGYSGSPVLLYHEASSFMGPHWNHPVELNTRTMRLLGIDCAHLMATTEGDSDFVAAVAFPGHPYPGKAKVNSGMMVVVPAWKIAELLDDKKVVAKEAELMQGPDIELDNVSSPVDKTATHMGRLLQVPKDEADEVHRGHGES